MPGLKRHVTQVLDAGANRVVVSCAQHGDVIQLPDFGDVKVQVQTHARYRGVGGSATNYFFPELYPLSVSLLDECKKRSAESRA